MVRGMHQNANVWARAEPHTEAVKLKRETADRYVPGRLILLFVKRGIFENRFQSA